MLQEKPGEAFNWKNRLDELDQLPGEAPFDKSAAWPVLHERLKKKPARLKQLFYWSAAACLILVTISSVVLFENRKDRDNIHQPPLSITPPSPIEHKELRRSSTIAADKKHEYKPTSIIRKPSTPPNRPPVVKELVVSVADLPSAGSMHVYRPEIQPDTSAMIAAFSVKQKLRVVHINDLDKPVAEPVSYVSKKHVKRSDGTGDVYPNFIVSRNASDDIIKINLTPPN